MPRKRDYAAERARRDERYRQRGWANYNQYDTWRRKLTDERVKELAEEIGGPVEPERSGSLMSRRANDRINSNRHNDEQSRLWDWQVRLLVASGRLKRRPRRSGR